MLLRERRNRENSFSVKELPCLVYGKYTKIVASQRAGLFICHAPQQSRCHSRLVARFLSLSLCCPIPIAILARWAQTNLES